MGFSDKQMIALQNFVKQVVVETIEEQEVVTKKDLSHLPSKDEFYEAMDKLSGEIEDLREEVTVHNAEVSRNSDKLEKLEKIHPSYSHS